MPVVMWEYDGNHAFFYKKMLYNSAMRSFKRSWFLMALVLLVQLPCFCAATPKFVSSKAHSCCPSETPMATELLQATCAHCASKHQVPLLEQASASSTDFSHALFSPLHTSFTVLAPTLTFSSSAQTDTVNLSHAPPSFIQHCKFVA